MTGSADRSTARRSLLALLTAGVLTCTLASCAPGTDSAPASGDVPDSEEIAGAKTKERIAEEGDAETEDGERSWPEGVPDEALEKHAELPEGFPADAFPLPAEAVIDDAGARSEGSWFVVLRAPDTAAAAELWNDIVSAGGFEQGDVGGTPGEDASAVLRKPGLEVTALTVTQDDGTVLLSYDLEGV